jgi:hypothetical protein
VIAAYSGESGGTCRVMSTDLRRFTQSYQVSDLKDHAQPAEAEPPAVLNVLRGSPSASPRLRVTVFT